MDISTEIAKIEGASFGEEVRQSIVDGLNKINSGTLPSVSVSDAGKFLVVNNSGVWQVKNGGVIPTPTGTKAITENGTYDVVNYANVDVSVQGGSVIQPLSITQNGTYSPPSGVDGYAPVVVSVPSSAINSNETLLRNWDFTQPINSRGNTRYRNSGDINVINGWKAYYLDLELTANGIVYKNYDTANNGNLYCALKISLPDISGKTFTLSCLVDGVLYHQTGTMPSSSGSVMRIDDIGGSGISFNCNIDSSAAMACYFYNDLKNTDGILIEGVKLEAGNQQTLAHQESGVWVLNGHQNNDVEQHFIRQLCNNN